MHFLASQTAAYLGKNASINVIDFLKRSDLCCDHMKSTQTVIVRSISKEAFDRAIQTGQNLQKSNQYGSEQHRKGFEIVREACIRFFGEDKLGEYDTF
jgi:hypothetical protein